MRNNADVLARRGSPFTAASGASFTTRWDWHKRQPTNLREAEHMIRRAYTDEVPVKLHDGPSAIGPDGTPRMSTRAEGYIFGAADGDDAAHDAETGMRDLIGWYFAPFRARLHQWSRAQNEASRRRAAIVSHVALGSQSGMAAAIAEGVPSWCAYVVAEHTLSMFYQGLTDVVVHAPREDVA